MTEPSSAGYGQTDKLLGSGEKMTSTEFWYWLFKLMHDLCQSVFEHHLINTRAAQTSAKQHGKYEGITGSWDPSNNLLLAYYGSAYIVSAATPVSASINVVAAKTMHQCQTLTQMDSSITCWQGREQMHNTWSLACLVSCTNKAPAISCLLIMAHIKRQQHQ